MDMKCEIPETFSREKWPWNTLEFKNFEDISLVQVSYNMESGFHEPPVDINLLKNYYRLTPEMKVDHGVDRLERSIFYVVEVSLAGYLRRHLNIFSEKNRLIISGQRPVNKRNCLEHKEFPVKQTIIYGNFELTIDFGGPIAIDKANLSNGILGMQVMFDPPTDRQRIEIK